MSSRINSMSLYRRRSSAFAGGFGYQNRRASTIAIPKGLASFRNSYSADKELPSAVQDGGKRNWGRLLVTTVLCYGNFCVGSAYSVLGPLFPSEVLFLYF